jgi:hypothetical protein
MQQIADWLEKLGVGQYAQRFAENDIDLDVLSDLTDQDLEKIGVASLGHRRKLLRAIADLQGVEKGAPTVTVVAAPTKARERRTLPSAVRSQCCSRTWSALRHFPPAWTRKICVRLFRPIKNASLRS